jgi:hypothetical protein
MTATTVFLYRTDTNIPEEVPHSGDYLTINFSPGSVARKRRWNNCGLSADFLGDYFASFFPGDGQAEGELNARETVKGSISFIANELIENAVKYNQNSIDLPISISLYLYEEKIIFLTKNYVSNEQAAEYQKFITELTTSDLDEFYSQQLERSACGFGGSCMGILTMMNDYGVQFCWNFQPVVEGVSQVYTQAHLAIK